MGKIILILLIAPLVQAKDIKCQDVIHHINYAIDKHYIKNKEFNEENWKTLNCKENFNYAYSKIINNQCEKLYSCFGISEKNPGNNKELTNKILKFLDPHTGLSLQSGFFNEINNDIPHEKSYYKVRDKILYIRLRSFREEDFDLVKKSLDNNHELVIIDLINNTGGYLDQAIRIADLFLDKDKEVIELRERNKKEKFSTKHEKFSNKPVILFSNKMTASASEILIGSLKEHLNPIIFGDKNTFGKGSVQEAIDRKDSGIFKVTTGLYLFNGESIQGEGIESDIIIYSEKEKIEKDYINHIKVDKIKKFKKNQYYKFLESKYTGKYHSSKDLKEEDIFNIGKDFLYARKHKKFLH